MIVTVEWKIRANGRHEGDKETVELTSFVQALVDQGRVVVVEEHPVIQDLDDAVVALDADTGSPVPVNLPQPGAEGLLVPAAKPRPRAPRK